MNLVKTLLLLVSFFVVNAKADAPLEYPKPQSPDELHSLFAQYFDAKDLNGLTTLFAANATFILDRDGRRATGHKEIAKALKPYLSFDSKMQTLSKSIHINGNIALIRSQWKLADSDISGTALEVMTFQQGGWVYLIDNPNGF
ncbi:protein of unknown function (DUF4440) [Shewanella psychrophila]|uniref:DUF4440 domain-containing protein n=1 Tax=Shewanella psychrophila TaxID=225848 RepID=A0A1S6HKU1_9GAMM|nr:nuclear transport factor 2 family protein [Shewanella psychrophila]AQS36130.1 protein of unknown function (DUF4440) [Shewanella psychrophila]